MELYIVRHGESVGNITPDKDMPDCPLTKLGKEQAKLVAEELVDAGITHILSSPLIRALQTAQPFAQTVQKPIHVMKEAYEVRDLDSCKGAKLSDLMDQIPEAIFPSDFEPNGWHYEGNETSEQAKIRAAYIIKQLKQYDENDRVVLFSHGVLNQYLIRELLGLTNSTHVHCTQENTSVNWFTITNDFTRINKIGDIHHLHKLSSSTIVSKYFQNLYF